MEIFELKKAAENTALYVTKNLRNIVDSLQLDQRIKDACLYAINNIAFSRDKAFIIQNVASICNINKINEILPYLCSVELLTLSVYIKDDIIDSNTKRRNINSVHIEFGTNIAMLVSDLFFSISISEIKSAKAISNIKKLELLRKHNSCYSNICLGQIIGEVMTLEEYNNKKIIALYDSLVGSTYKYFCEIPAIISDYSDLEKIHRLGNSCGLATQIRNDIEDITADQNHAGTDFLLDIIYGKPNLLISSLLERLHCLNKTESEFILSLFGSKNREWILEEKRNLLFELCIKSNALESTLNHLLTFCDNSISILDQMPDSIGKRNLIKYMKFLKYE